MDDTDTIGFVVTIVTVLAGLIAVKLQQHRQKKAPGYGTSPAFLDAPMP